MILKISKFDSTNFGTHIGGICHYFNPAFEGGHLQQRQISIQSIIKVYSRIDPGEIFSRVLEAFFFRRRLLDRHSVIVWVHALVEAARKELNSHYAKQKPKHQTDKQHIYDRWYSAEKTAYNNLFKKIF